VDFSYNCVLIKFRHLVACQETVNFTSHRKSQQDATV